MLECSIGWAEADWPRAPPSSSPVLRVGREQLQLVVGVDASEDVDEAEHRVVWVLTVLQQVGLSLQACSTHRATLTTTHRATLTTTHRLSTALYGSLPSCSRWASTSRHAAHTGPRSLPHTGWAPRCTGPYRPAAGGPQPPGLQPTQGHAQYHTPPTATHQPTHVAPSSLQANITSFHVFRVTMSLIRE